MIVRKMKRPPGRKHGEDTGLKKRASKTPKKPAPKKSIGRPTGYQPQFASQAKKLCELGATDRDLADFFGVSINTVGNWKTQHAEFLGALKAGKNSADDRVERSLYTRAVGYTFDAVKIFLPKDSRQPVLVPYRQHMPPDTTACIFWLKNRRKDVWRDHQEHTGADGGPPIVEIRWKEPEAQ